MDPEVDKEMDEADDLAKRMALRPPGAVLWTWQSCDVVIAVCAVSTAFIGLDFMLIPLTMAYMTTYAMGPLMDLLEARPYTCIGGKELCAGKTQWTKMVPVYSVDEQGETRKDPKGNPIPLRDDNRNVVLEPLVNQGDDTFFQLDESGNRIKDKFGKDKKIEGCSLASKNFMLLLKVPHVIACLITLLFTIALLAVLAGIVGASFAEFGEGEEAKDQARCDTCCFDSPDDDVGKPPDPNNPSQICKRQDTVNDKLTLMANEFINQLEEDGVKIIRPRICESRDTSGMKIKSHIKDEITVESPQFTEDEFVQCRAVYVPLIRPCATIEACSDCTAADDEAECLQNNLEIEDTRSCNCTAPIAAIAKSDRLAMREYNAAEFRCEISFEYMMTRGYGMQMQGTTCTLPTLDYNTGRDYESLQPEDHYKLVNCLKALVESGDLLPGAENSQRMRMSLGGLREGLELGRNPRGCESVDNGEFLDGLELALESSPQVMNCTHLGDLLEDAESDEITEVCSQNFTLGRTDYLLAHMCPQECSRFDPDLLLDDTRHQEVCRSQAAMMTEYYKSELDSFRSRRPPADMTMAIRLFNFTETLSQELPNCTAKNLFATREDLEREKEKGIVRGYTWEEFTGIVNTFGLFMNDLVLIVLLAVYILLERPEGSTLGGGDSRVLSEVEALITDYIILKAALSFLTGFLTAVILLACRVQLALIFGLLAFLLNFIPSVGSMIAMVLPIPLVWLDDNISMTMKIVAIVGPASVQGYIGNALEPSVFGKSMNMTAISVLLALVLFGFVWGLSGAVLSVPFLGIIKIVCHHTDHPLAKYFLITVREDPNYP